MAYLLDVLEMIEQFKTPSFSKIPIEFAVNFIRVMIWITCIAFGFGPESSSSDFLFFPFSTNVNKVKYSSIENQLLRYEL